MDAACSTNDASTCCTASSDRFVVACSGASNVGQVTNLLAIKMTQQGLARMTCLAALGAHLPAYIESVKDTELVVLDGCPVACAKLVVEHAGVKDYKYFVISEMGVDKAKRFNQVENETEQVWEKVISKL
ncbi:MAG TPA: putative zinc-binding protein [Syntrophomonadaceae bacterium]|nr:putative zinc-binding protein [Syntrophomonadaceae bacterium]